MCQFNTAVHQLRIEAADDTSNWTVVFDHIDSPNTFQERTFEYVVVSTGMYGWPPHMPVARDSEKFKGDIQHSCTFTDQACVKGKKVLTVGAASRPWIML